VVGALHVRPGELSSEQLALLEALGSALADAARRGALRGEVETAAAGRAVAAERERIASDLHDTVGQLFVAIGLLARRHAEELPWDSPWAVRTRRLAELADQGKWEIDQAVRALAFVPAARRGLGPSLRALGRSVAADSGIEVLVEVEGRAVRLAPRIEQALYRVAHEALINAWRHARCGVVRAELRFERDAVSLRIQDDGVGLQLRHPEDGVHMGIDGMRRAVNEVEGSIRVRTARPRGVVVEARVPVSAR
jgi:signal transduction histidine kinase